MGKARGPGAFTGHTSVHRLSSHLTGEAPLGSWLLVLFWITGRARPPQGSVDEGTRAAPATSLSTSPFKLARKLLWTLPLCRRGQKDHFCPCRLVNDLAAVTWQASSCLPADKQLSDGHRKEQGPQLRAVPRLCIMERGPNLSLPPSPNLLQVEPLCTAPTPTTPPVSANFNLSCRDWI